MLIEDEEVLTRGLENSTCEVLGRTVTCEEANALSESSSSDASSTWSVIGDTGLVDGGTNSSRNDNASVSDIGPLPSVKVPRSILFPTTTQQ